MDASRRIALIALTIGLLCVPQAASAAGFQILAHSATATSMGNTGVANPDEPNASFWNPAAMTFDPGLEIFTNATVIALSSAYLPPGAPEDAQIDGETSPAPLASAHLEYSLTDDLAVGAGLSLPYGLTKEWPENWVGREVVEFAQLATVNFTPSIAYKLSGIDLSVAAGAQIMYSFVELEQDIGLPDGSFVQAELGGDGWGFGGIAAVMYQPLEGLTIGAQYRSRVNVEYDNAEIHFEGEEDTGFASTFQDGTGSTEIEMPDAIMVGVSYQWTQRLYTAFDVVYTVWNTFDEINVQVETDDPQAFDGFVLEENWDNAFAFRFGGQYDLTEQIPLRLGASYDLTPIPDETISALLPRNDSWTVSAGLGYHWGKYRLDAGYEFVSVQQREVTNPEGPPGTYDGLAHVGLLSFGVGYE